MSATSNNICLFCATIWLLCQIISCRPKWRILDGAVAEPHEFPSIVAISNYEYGLFCSGTLLNKRVVLTAAHCVDDSRNFSSSKLEWERLTVHVGMHSVKVGLRSKKDYYQVSKMVLHENYNDSTSNSQDIALLFLNRDVAESCFVQFVRLPSKNMTYPPYPYTVQLAGWGAHRNKFRFQLKRRSRVLRKSKITVFDRTCPAYAAQSAKYFLCMSVTKFYQRVFCDGDSGGPVFLRDPVTKAHIQIGVIVVGHVRCRNNAPVHAMRVSQFLDWIHLNTRRLMKS